MAEDLRRNLDFMVEQHYKDTTTFRGIMKDAYSGAQLTYQKVKDDIQDQRIKNLESMLSKNQSALDFILDLGISLIIGPVFGHLTEYGLSKMCGKLIRSRENTKNALVKFEKAAGKVVQKPSNVRNPDSEYNKILRAFWNDEMEAIEKKRFSFLMDKDFKDRTAFARHNAAAARIKGITDEVNKIEYFVLLTPVFNDMMQVLCPAFWSYINKTGSSSSDVQTQNGLNPEMDNMRGINTTDPAHFFKDIVEREIAIQDSIDNAQYRFLKEYILTSDDEGLLKRTIAYFDRLDYFPQDGITVVRIKKDLEFIYTCILFIITYGPPLEWGSDSEQNLIPGNKQKRYYTEAFPPSKLDRAGDKVYFKYEIYIPRPAIDVLLNEVIGYGILDGKTFAAHFGLQRSSVNPVANKYYFLPEVYEAQHGKPYEPVSVTDPKSTDYSLDDFIIASTQNWIHENIYVPFLQSKVMFDDIKNYALTQH